MKLFRKIEFILLIEILLFNVGYSLIKINFNENKIFVNNGFNNININKQIKIGGDTNE